MRVTDLMVGDWVNMGNPIDDKLVPTKIKNIYGEEINCKTGHTSDDVPTIIYGEWLRYAQPIPLTEEILAKNFGGYDHIDYDKEGRLPCYFVGNRRIFVDSVMDKGRCFYFCHKDDWAGLHDIEIHYVHQLQHLLRLCGIDKEISI